MVSPPQIVGLPDILTGSVGGSFTVITMPPHITPELYVAVFLAKYDVVTEGATFIEFPVA